MEKNITVKRIENSFANGGVGIEVTIFRNKILLTENEADELLKSLQFALCKTAE